MSVSSATAAKRRRTVVNNAPIFRSTVPQTQNNSNMNSYPTQNHPPQSTPVSATTNTQYIDSKKPMPLQQVISVLDNRILYLESHLMNNTTPNSYNDENENENENSPTYTKLEIDEIIANSIKNHIIEFDSRYEILATEIASLKEFVLSLQTYTFDVNATLDKERNTLMNLIENSNNKMNNHLGNIEDMIPLAARFDIETQTILVDHTDNETQINLENPVEIKELSLDNETQIETKDLVCTEIPIEAAVLTDECDENIMFNVN
jgi:hypothetical protein